MVLLKSYYGKFKNIEDLTKKLFRKPVGEVETREISKAYGQNWFYSDNGEWCEGDEVDKLVRSFESKNGCDLEKTEINQSTI